jgi:uncharacterized protein
MITSKSWVWMQSDYIVSVTHIYFINMQYLLIFGAALLAGGINGIAGGGSFILFPVLMFVGIPPIMANATNAIAH